MDGVIVGEKIGHNAPHPHAEVVQRLVELRKKGIGVVLCTARPHYSIQKIIDDAKLNNFHITAGGAVIIDPLDKKIYKAYPIQKKQAIQIIETYLNEQAYTELYTVDRYFIQKDQQSEITKKHTFTLQKNPQIVPSLVSVAEKYETIKILPIAKDQSDKTRLTQIFRPFEGVATLSWGIHPAIAPLQFGNITAAGISKRESAMEVVKSLDLSFSEVLGIGDSMSDWQFMELCEYAGAMENASEELKKLVLAKGNKGYVGKSVDENGILDILKFFGI